MTNMQSKTNHDHHTKESQITTVRWRSEDDKVGMENGINVCVGKIQSIWYIFVGVTQSYNGYRARSIHY